MQCARPCHILHLLLPSSSRPMIEAAHALSSRFSTTNTTSFTSLHIVHYITSFGVFLSLTNHFTAQNPSYPLHDTSKPGESTEIHNMAFSTAQLCMVFGIFCYVFGVSGIVSGLWAGIGGTFVGSEKQHSAWAYRIISSSQLGRRSAVLEPFCAKSMLRLKHAVVYLVKDEEVGDHCPR